MRTIASGAVTVRPVLPAAVGWLRGRSAAALLFTQLLVVGGAAVCYFQVRGLTEGRPDAAVANAHDIVAAERLVGIYWEEALQDAVIGSGPAVRLLNGIYIFGHWPVIITTLTWLLFRHPTVFVRTRNAMLASGTLGLVIFAAYPVAPPRLAGLGLVDTVTDQSEAYRVLQPPGFTNQYAAMPSLHVGWNLLIAIAIVTTANSAVFRLIGLLMPLAMAAALVLTANHYLLDALAGAGLTTVAWMVVPARGVSVRWAGSARSRRRRSPLGSGRAGPVW